MKQSKYGKHDKLEKPFHRKDPIEDKEIGNRIGYEGCPSLHILVSDISQCFDYNPSRIDPLIGSVISDRIYLIHFPPQNILPSSTNCAMVDINTHVPLDLPLLFPMVLKVLALVQFEELGIVFSKSNGLFPFVR